MVKRKIHKRTLTLKNFASNEEGKYIWSREGIKTKDQYGSYYKLPY